MAAVQPGQLSAAEVTPDPGEAAFLMEGSVLHHCPPTRCRQSPLLQMQKLSGNSDGKWMFGKNPQEAHGTRIKPGTKQGKAQPRPPTNTSLDSRPWTLATGPTGLQARPQPLSQLMSNCLLRALHQDSAMLSGLGGALRTRRCSQESAVLSGSSW